MKKLIALFFVCVCLWFLQSGFSFSNSVSAKTGTHIFYTTQSFFDQNCTTTKNGNTFLIESTIKNTQAIFEKLDKTKILGESFCFCGNNSDIEKILRKLGAKTIKTEIVENIYITYAFSSKLTKSAKIDGKQVNLQIAQKQNLITIGSPIILGSF